MKKILQTSGMMIVCASLFACASPIQTMSARDALKFGTNQFYEMPSYRMDMSAKVVQLGIVGMNTDDTFKESETFNKYMNFFGKKFIFSGTGVFDTVNDQYQIIPEYGYEAKNLNAHIRFPIVLDRKAKLFYADLSALDGIVTNLDNAGKYSRFDLSKLPIPEGSDKKLVDVIRKYSNLMLDKVPVESITEQPLTAEDRKLRAVRKLQLTLKPQEQIALFPDMMDEMIGVFAPSANKESAEFKQDADKFKTEIAKLLSPESRDLYTLTFNRAGQIVAMKADSNYLITPPNVDEDLMAHTDPADATPTDRATQKGFQMHFVTDMTVRDIGNAKLIDPPTADNSVDGMENLRNSPIGKSFFKKYDENVSSNDVDAAHAVEAASQPVKKTKKSRKKTR